MTQNNSLMTYKTIPYLIFNASSIRIHLFINVLRLSFLTLLNHQKAIYLCYFLSFFALIVIFLHEYFQLLCS